MLSAAKHDCHFERQGPGGAIVAQDVFGADFDTDQWIIDIDTSDAAFKTNDACGIWGRTRH
jgi:hypothetical protein